MRIAWLTVLLAISSVACGGSGPSAAPAAAPAASTPQTRAAAAAPAPELAPERATGPETAAADAKPEAPPAASKPDSTPKHEPDPNAARDVTYLVAPDGLKISVAGVRFTVSAVAVQIGAGWGAKIGVVASALDGKPHSLASTKTGPLAFAGAVSRSGQAEPERFGDERNGDGELGIFGDDPSKFNRTWPGKGSRPLLRGDALDLQVALWGLGVERDSRRPVKQFFHVRMQVDKGKPRAIVEPPASATAS